MNYLKEKRKERGITQNDLANVLGITRQQISQYERGVCTPPAKMGKKLAKALNISNWADIYEEGERGTADGAASGPNS